MVERMALKYAQKSNADCFRHSAVITRNGKFIAGACNQIRKTHPEGSGPFCTVHAEVAAIRAARNTLRRFRPNDDLSDCEIFVMRINKKGVMRLSKPCSDCQNLIDRYGLKASWTTNKEKTA